MRRLAEVLTFGALAAGAHLAALAAVHQSTGLQSGGQGGTALVTLQGATPAIEQMVERWEAPPPQVAPPPQGPAAPRPDSVTPAAPTPEPAPPLHRTDAPPVPAPPAAPALPRAATRSFAPPPPKAPPPVARPVAPRETAPPPAKPAPGNADKAAQRPPKPAAPETPPAKKKSTASAGAAAQTSAGTGGQAQAGAGGASKAATLSKGQRDSLKASWGAKVRARIERQKRYPRGAHGSGSVIVRVVVGRDGRLLRSSVAGSSGKPAFDKEALAAVKRARRFPAAPKGLDAPSYTLQFRINFSR